MSPETELILHRIDAAERAVNRRIEDVIASQATLTEKVDVAARDALAGRLVAEEANLKVGKVHEAQKTNSAKVAQLTTDVTKLVAAESALSKYAGPAVRWKAITVFLMGGGALEWLFHRFLPK